MLQPSNTNTDNSSPSLSGAQMSPNSNPDSPKSNTSPEVSKTNASENINSNVEIHSPTAKIPKFIITPQNNQSVANNNNNAALKTNEEGLRYSMERLKQLTEQHQQRLSPNAEEIENEVLKNGSRRSQTPPNIQLQAQRKLMDLPSVRHLARPEPLQHPHAALLQQHPHLLQNPQFLAAAAQAQQQHHQQQQHNSQLHHHHHQHPAFHQHLPAAAAAAAAFHLRGPLSSNTTTTLTLPPPANSPLSPPTSPNQNLPTQQQPSGQATHSEQHQQQPHVQTGSSTNPSLQLSTNSLQPSSSSTTTTTLLLSTNGAPVAPTHLVNGQISIPPPLSSTHLALSPSSSSTTISSTSSQHDMDLEKLKLVAQAQAAVARSSAVAGVSLNGQQPTRPDLSDYGFRIQLGGLAAAAAAAAATSRQIAAANYARSDTSEELNVDGNDEESNDGSQGTPSVSPKCCHKTKHVYDASNLGKDEIAHHNENYKIYLKQKPIYSIYIHILTFLLYSH